MDLDYGDYFQFVIALIFVLALIGVLAMVARRMGFGYRTPNRGKQAKRLSLIEVMPLDARRRIALIRRDSVEHLILLGNTNDILIESGVPAPADADFSAALAETTAMVEKPGDGR
jgi:flagellar protein FliO/FliZ